MNNNNIINRLSIAYFIFLLVILILFGYTPMNDTDGYIEYARICVQQGEPYPCNALIKGTPFIWNIGSINLIALSLQLFGSFYPVLILMCILKAMTAWLLAKITQCLCCDKIAIITLLLYVCYPNNWGQSTMLLSEIPMISLALLSLYMILIQKKTCFYILAGIIMAWANWFRPIAVLFIISILAYIILFQRKEILRKSVPFLLGFGCMVMTFGLECYTRTGYFVYQCESFWYNMADDAYDGATPDPHFGQPLYPKGTPRYIENMQDKTCFECTEIWKQRCIPWLLTHKVEYLSKIPYRIYYMYQNDIDNMAAFLRNKENAENNYILLPYRHIIGEIGNLNSTQYLALLCTIYYFLIILTALVGSIYIVIKRQWQQGFLPLFIPIFGTFSLVALVQGETRFKSPFMPFIMILSAYGIIWMKNKFKNNETEYRNTHIPHTRYIR